MPGDHGLELEDGLEDALGHLGLVGRVGGHELGPPGQRPGHRRDLVVVGAAAGEADQAVGAGPVAVGERLHVGEDVGLTHPVGQLEAALEPARPRARRRTARPATTGRGTPACSAISSSVWGM